MSPARAIGMGIRKPKCRMMRGLFLGLCAATLTGCPRHESKPSEAAPSSAPPESLAAQSRPAAPREASPSDAHGSANPTAFDERKAERHAFIEQTVRERHVEDRLVLEAMRKVPRHGFVPSELASMAYTDRPLPIPGGQTISQPYIVAFMTEAAEPTPRSKCLEIGTGSGYQAAVLAEICHETYSIEYLPEVAEFGRQNLRRLGYGPEDVHLRVGDGYRGWPNAAPFDVIVVTAAPESVPRPLLDQLAVGGHLVIPVGGEHDVQVLERWTRKQPGPAPDAFETERLMGVRFVPFLGDAVRAEE